MPLAEPLSLDQIRTAAPCPMRWADMQGDDTKRFCHHCALHVYNIATMTRAEAESLISHAEGRVCALLFRRADGTVITKDCPVGITESRARRMRRIRGMLSVAALAIGLAGTWALGPVRWTSFVMRLSDLQPFETIAEWVGAKPPPSPYIGSVF